MPAKKKITRAKTESAPGGKIIALVPKGLGLTRREVKKLHEALQVSARAAITRQTLVGRVAVCTCDVECIDNLDD